ncbi:MAG: hypothetical protein SFZ02_12245 [bacterium]|nr:hypothetical protein [bacterium]
MNLIGTVPLTGVKVFQLATDFSHPVFIYMVGIKAEVRRTIAMLHSSDEVEVLVGENLVAIKKSWNEHLTSVTSALPITLPNGTVQKGWSSAFVYDRRALEFNPEAYTPVTYILSDDPYRGFQFHLQNKESFPAHTSWIAYIWDKAHALKLLTPLTGYGVSGWKMKVNHDWSSIISEGLKNKDISL